MTVLSLRAGRLSVDLSPGAGGSVSRFAVDGAGDIFKRPTPEALASGVGKDMSCYPLVPFSNRIANGHLQFNGESIRLQPNWPGVRHPMHGDGWSRAWDVVRHDDVSAEMIYEHDGRAGWPFRYRAAQRFALLDSGLVVGMSITNLENRDVPAGLGLHPFFTREPDTELACHAEAVWRTDAEVLPVDRVAVPPAWDFSRPRRVEGAGLDNCFDGWDGRATIAWPGRNMHLVLSATDAFRHLVLYIPDGQPYFCVEPVSHANGKVGRSLLAANATLAGEISFRLVLS